MPFVWLLPVVLIAGTAVVAALFAHPIETPTPYPTVLATTTTEPSPTSSPLVLRSLGEEGTPKPTPTPSFVREGNIPLTSLPVRQAGGIEGVLISFLDLPSALPAGEKTKITIKIDGPSGTKGDNATIKVKYHASEEKNSSKSSIKNDISNSFGSFTTPATFSMNLSLGQEPAPVKLTASAEINGQTIEISHMIKL